MDIRLQKKRQTYSFDPQPSDVTLFLHTSGTTAKPKGVPLTHANLVASMNNIATTYRLTPADSVLLIMPLFHVHGLMSALLTTLATGGTVILPPQVKFSASQFWHNATVWSSHVGYVCSHHLSSLVASIGPRLSKGECTAVSICSELFVGLGTVRVERGGGEIQGTLCRSLCHDGSQSSNVFQSD